MEKLKVDFIVDILSYESCTYDIYVEFCESNNRVKELFMCDDEGINTLFDTPFDAVYTMHKKGFILGNFGYIYRDKNDELCVCDYIEECKLIDMQEIAKWIVDGKCTQEVYKILEKFELPFEFCEKHYNGDDKDFSYQFADWVDNELGLVNFIKSDWMELIGSFNVVK
jgi:hypothetical protein